MSYFMVHISWFIFHATAAPFAAQASAPGAPSVWLPSRRLGGCLKRASPGRGGSKEPTQKMRFSWEFDEIFMGI